MRKERHSQQQAFLHQMDKIHTHPGIKTFMLCIMNQEWTSDTNLEEQLTGGDERLLKEAVTQQIQLGQRLSLEKGFLCNAWGKSQEEWCKTHDINKKDKYTWSCNAIIALQTYTLNVWKHRNTFIHGSNKKENK